MIGRIVNKIRNFAELQLERLCGDDEKFRIALDDAFGTETSERISAYRGRLRKRYLITASIGASLLLLSLIIQLAGNNSLEEITRPEPDSENMVIPVEISATYDGMKADSAVELQIKSRNMTAEEMLHKLDECESFISEKFSRDENANLIATGPIELPMSYYGGRINIEWSSSDPVLITEDGNVDVIALAGESEVVTLTAELSFEEYSRTLEYKVTVTDEREMYPLALRTRLGTLVSSMNDDLDNSRLVFPDEMDDCIRIKWKKRSRTWAPIIMLIVAVAFFLIYSGRYRKAMAMAREYRQSVIEAFPAVIDKMILLLNSGLTVFSALMRVSQDYERNNRSSKSALGMEAANIGMRVRNTNADFVEEWRALASRMESGDMMRFCTILAENISTGGGLAEKLEAEGANLREMRRKDIRKKIQLVDSKMIVPMMIMLFSLILITVAPAMLSFS